MKRLWKVWIENQKRLKADYRKYLNKKLLIRVGIYKPLIISHMNKRDWSRTGAQRKGFLQFIYFI